MSFPSKNAYPKAQPLYSPEELAAQALNQRNEELAARAKRLSLKEKDQAENAARLRSWTLRLVGVGVFVVLLAAGSITFVLKKADFGSRAGGAVASDESADPAKQPGALQKPGSRALLESLPALEVKRAPTALPARAVAKPDGAAFHKASFLEALGGLSATHLYQSQLNIGLLADGVESETYTTEEAEKNLKTVVDMMKRVDQQHAKLIKAGLEREDRESIQQIQTVIALLHLQGNSLRAYWETGATEQANQYHQARKAAWQGLTIVLGIDK